MTAKDLQHALFARFGDASALMIPNYTPAKWFECDLYRVTKAGYAEEFEIKLSVSDFKADALKGPDERERQRMASYPIERQQKLGFEFRSKHQRMAEGDSRGPCRFWFVMPEEIAEKVEIPAWAGLITFRTWRKHAYPTVKKQAPRLHKQRADAAIVENARKVFYYRYWNIRRGMTEETVPAGAVE